MKTFIYLIVTVAVIVGLYLILRPKDNQSQTQDQNSQTTQSQTKTYTLVVKDKKLVEGPDTIQVTEGDNVSITITNDADEELHLHGYDKAVELTANQPATLNFTANLTGRFEYELEGSSTQIGVLEVLPK